LADGEVDVLQRDDRLAGARIVLGEAAHGDDVRRRLPRRLCRAGPQITHAAWPPRDIALGNGFAASGRRYPPLFPSEAMLIESTSSIGPCADAGQPVPSVGKSGPEQAIGVDVPELSSTWAYSRAPNDWQDRAVDQR